jgi:putative hydrolase of the HAD superfamily
MNGLFRHWRDLGAAKAEHQARLPTGTLARYAYDHPTYRLARVGVLTDQQWADDVADRLAADFGPHVHDALPLWRSDRGECDRAMVRVLDQLRQTVPVGVLSNSTDALPSDLHHHGITFDFVLPSAHLGVDKPSPLAFQAAADMMSVPVGHLAYFDDEPTFVTAARHAGLQAHHFTGVERFVFALREARLLPEQRLVGKN